jgi:hypothetical protein
MLPLVPIAVALIGSLLLGAVALALRSPDPGRGAPGSRLTDALGFLTDSVSAWCFWALGLGAVWLSWAIWTRPALLGLSDSAFTGGGGVWAPVSALVVGCLALARVVPVDPRRWREDIGGALARLRVGADIAYDVATYLRIDHDGDGVRSRVVARYRALLDELERQGYREVVVAAHSQGSMYSVTTIAGDRHRRDPEPGSGGWGVAPWCDARPGSRLRVALLTFGCPIRQTYEARLPGQYAWTGDARLAARLRPVAPAWINVFRARDYIGRGVFHDPLGATAIEQGRYRSHRADAAAGRGPDLVDVCIRGTGSHTGYFGDPELTLWIDHLLRRALGEPVDLPAGYSPGSEAP